MAEKKTSSAKKTAAKKTTAKETAAKKTTAKKTAGKKTTAKKTAAKKTTTKKIAAKKTTTKKIAAKKTTAKKVAPKKAPEEKVTVQVAPAVEKPAKKPGLLRITQTRSPIGRPANQKATLKALGLRRIRHTVEQRDTPSIRGMVRTVIHLVDVVEVQGS